MNGNAVFAKPNAIMSPSNWMKSSAAGSDQHTILGTMGFGSFGFPFLGDWDDLDLSQVPYLHNSI